MQRLELVRISREHHNDEHQAGRRGESVVDTVNHTLGPAGVQSTGEEEDRSEDRSEDRRVKGGRPGALGDTRGTATLLVAELQGTTSCKQQRWGT